MTQDQTIAQLLKVKTFPFEIKDENEKNIYWENSNGFWRKSEYDSDGNLIYFEDSDGDWFKYEYDCNGKNIYYESSYGYWFKKEYDLKGNVIYYENSYGNIFDDRSKVEITLEEIATLKGVSVSQIRVKE